MIFRNFGAKKRFAKFLIIWIFFWNSTKTSRSALPRISGNFSFLLEIFTTLKCKPLDLVFENSKFSIILFKKSLIKLVILQLKLWKFAQTCRMRLLIKSESFSFHVKILMDFLYRIICRLFKRYSNPREETNLVFTSYLITSVA